MIHKWKGNVNRAILDAAQAFNSLGKVSEEYLTNMLDAFETILHDNPDKNIKREDCKIQFIIDYTKHKILFLDEHPLMGMSSKFIFDHFFNIHGQNESRKRYINVRGKHGTGKSAAFGIGAEYLQVSSVYKGKRTIVKSTLESLQNEGDEPADLQDIEVDKKTDLENGTTIEIQLPNDNYLQFRITTSALEHIKKVFGKHLNKYNVEFVEIRKKNNINKERIIYQPREAVYEKEQIIPREVEEIIGKSTFIIKRAAEIAENEDESGILITSNEFLKEQTMFELDSEPFSNYFFGEWEIPKLDEYRGPNAPSLSTRDLVLNKNNEMVKAIYEFGKKTLQEEIRAFAKDERARKKDEALKRLSNMANELANILNDDFSEYEEISKKKEKGEKGKAKDKETNEDDVISVVPNNNENIVSKIGNELNIKEHTDGSLTGTSGEGDYPEGNEGDKPSIDPKPHQHSGPLDTKYEEAESKEDSIPAERRERKRYRAGGGFKIEFASLNHNVFIARVDITTKIIIVNIDSEVMRTHLKNCGGNEEFPTFKMFAYSVAIDEYSRAVVNIMAANHEFYGNSSEEMLQEGISEMNSIKKRVLDKLSITLSELYEEPLIS